MIVRPHSILLDSEALSVLAADGRAMQAWSVAARRTDSILYASTLTLAEVTDGSARDASVRRIIKVLRLHLVDAETGFRAGALRASTAGTRRKARDLTVDAVVAATALAVNRAHRPPGRSGRL